MSYHRFLPPSLEARDLIAVVGLLSDTHMPLRRRLLPSNLADVLGGVDFLLHAGDVGELWVLDQLSSIAPVIAVHGNDDTEDAQRELPFQQIVALAGQRLLLWHSHFPDRAEEMEFRKDDDLYRSIQRNIDQANHAGAKIVVFGHWHIPLVYRADDLLIVNPGALASGNEFTRMLRNTVALLFVETTGTAHVVHIDLEGEGKHFQPQIAWDAGFMVAANQFSKSIVSTQLRPIIALMHQTFAEEEILAIRPYIAAKATPIWESGGGELGIAAVEDALLNATDLDPALRKRALKLWRSWQ